MVEILFTLPASEATMAAVNAATDKPFNPVGKKVRSLNRRHLYHLPIVVNAIFIQNKSCNTRQHTITGINNFKKPANKIPVRAVCRSAPNALCVMY